MTSPNYNVGGATRPEITTDSLTVHIDSLQPGQIPDMHEADLIARVIQYGSETAQETARISAVEQLNVSLVHYIRQLEPYTRIGREYPLPAETRSPKKHGERYGPNSGSLDAWLHVVRRFDSESANAAMTAVSSEIVNGFNEAAYDREKELYLATHDDDISRPLQRAGEDICGLTSLQLESYATDSTTIRQFMASKYFGRFGTQTHRNNLLVRLVDLEGPTDAEGWITEEYAEIVSSLSNELTSSDSAGNYVLLNTLAHHTPEIIPTLAEQAPRRKDSMYTQVARDIMKLDSNTRTPGQQELLDHIEADLSTDLFSYLSLSDVYMKVNGKLTAEQAKILATLSKGVNDDIPSYGKKAMERRQSTNIEEFWEKIEKATLLASRFASDEDFDKIIAENPWATNIDASKSIVIRRLARQGRVDEALELVDKKTQAIDSISLVTIPIHNLLTIYEESGNKEALSEAYRRIETPIRSWARMSTDDHSFALHTYIAARKQGNEELAMQASEAMNRGLDTANNAEWEMRTNTSNTIVAFLDEGEIDTAAAYALYKRDTTNDDDQYDGVLSIVKAYMDAGDQQKAIQFVNDHIVNGPPTKMHQLYAIDYILSNGTSFIPTTYGQHINTLDN